MTTEDDTLEERTGVLVLPEHKLRPLRSILARLGIAVACVLVTATVVYAERRGYSNSACDLSIDPDCTLTPLDAFYYATVTLSTTGYGDIAPVDQLARATNIFLITPLRFLFLIVLVGTTIEVLTKRTQYEWRSRKWRKKMDDHTVIVGYGIKGRSAVAALLDNGVPSSKIVVVARDPASIREAEEQGVSAVRGDARSEPVLQRAKISQAKRVVIATDEDATSVLVTMLVRRLSPNATIVSAARETSNAQFLRDSGADSVIVTAEAIGRLLSLSLVSPTAGNLMEDLLESGRGLEMVERDITREELGIGPDDLDAHGELVLAVIRDGETHRFDGHTVKALNRNDKIVVIRESRERNRLEDPETD